MIKVIRSMLISLMIFLTISTISAQSQQQNGPTLKIGDPAPELKVAKWLKGTSVNEFKKGEIYVVEFWAT